jgi:hypothetical protein
VIVHADAGGDAIVAGGELGAAIDGSMPAVAPVAPVEVWLRGSTHVHARPSGDSSTPIPDVIAWYEKHHYDFIVLTDHNQVSEAQPGTDTSGKITVRDPPGGLIVLAGIELTHNPTDCLPRGDVSGRCRIHVNLIGVTARPGIKIEWADRSTHDRIAKYQAAVVAARTLGGIAQLNHPQWFWGMTPDVLVEIARRGMRLYEVANAQFTKWNAGDQDHLSTEALWDAALAHGVTLWAVASDDAHDFDTPGKYPAGGGWVMVRARRDPQAILDALAGGRFYASNGVVLDRAEVVNGELVVEVAATEPPVTIEFVENGKLVASMRAKIGRRALPPAGYVRAVVTRGDGKKAWVQPARRSPQQP